MLLVALMKAKQGDQRVCNPIGVTVDVCSFVL